MKRIIFCILIFLGNFYLLKAQTITVTSEAEVFISEGAAIYVSGSLLNNGTIENKKGTLAVSGDWTNNNTYSAEKDSLVFNGSERQNIFQNNMIVSSVIFDGGGEKFLLSEISVLDEIVFKNGIVNTTENSLQISELAFVHGGSFQSFVEGALIIEGGENRFFPIGKDGIYRPVALYNLRGNVPIIKMEAFNNSFSPSYEGNISYVYNNFYWKKTILSGSFTAANIEISYLPEDNIFDSENLVVAQTEDLTQNFTNLGRSKKVNSSTIGFVTAIRNATATYFALSEGEALNTSPLFVPNALSPFATNKEDRAIKVFGDVIDEKAVFYFVVFNKWGNAVFETSSLEFMQTIGWQGKDQTTNEYLPAGNYEYRMIATTITGESTTYKGVVLLVQ